MFEVQHGRFELFSDVWLFLGLTKSMFEGRCGLNVLFGILMPLWKTVCGTQQTFRFRCSHSFLMAVFAKKDLQDVWCNYQTWIVAFDRMISVCFDIEMSQ